MCLCSIVATSTKQNITQQKRYHACDTAKETPKTGFLNVFIWQPLGINKQDSREQRANAPKKLLLPFTQQSLNENGNNRTEGEIETDAGAGKEHQRQQPSCKGFTH